MRSVRTFHIKRNKARLDKFIFDLLERNRENQVLNVVIDGKFYLVIAAVETDIGLL